MSMPAMTPVVNAVLTLIDAMTFEEREIIAARITSYGAVPLPNGGDATRFVSALFDDEKEWSVEQIIAEAKDARIDSLPKQIYNALGYLTRRGAIRRLGYGRYSSLVPAPTQETTGGKRSVAHD